MSSINGFNFSINNVAVCLIQKLSPRLITQDPSFICGVEVSTVSGNNSVYYVLVNDVVLNEVERYKDLQFIYTGV